MLKWSVTIQDLFKSDTKAVEVAKVEALRAQADQQKLTNDLLDLLVSRAIEVKDGDEVEAEDGTVPLDETVPVDRLDPQKLKRRDAPTMPFLDPKTFPGGRS